MRLISDDGRTGVRSTLCMGMTRHGLLAVALAGSLACNADLQLAPRPEHRQLDPARAAAAPNGPNHGTEVSRTASRANASRSSGGAFAELRRLREIVGFSTTEWRASLDEIARVSPRGESAVATRRIILEALEAESDAEFHRILRRLPRRLAELPNRPSSILANAYSMSEEHGRRTSGPNAGVGDVHLMSECTTIWEGLEYTGECATPEEIEAALALVAALDAEIAADYAEAQTLCVETFGTVESCGPGSVEPYEEEEEFQPAADGELTGSLDLAGDLSSGPGAMFGVSLAKFSGTTCDRGDLATGGNEDQVAETSCAGPAIMAGFGLASWLISKAGAYNVIKHGASKSGVGIAVAGIIIGGVSAGYSIGDYLVCVKARSTQ